MSELLLILVLTETVSSCIVGMVLSDYFHFLSNKLKSF